MEIKGVKSVALQSVEDYLEAILMLSKESNEIRSVDLAKRFSYSKASISVALKKLEDENFIYFNEKKHIFLTESGLEIAIKVYEKHETLREFFKTLGVTEPNLTDDACAIEHILSDETISAIKKFNKEHEK